MAATKLPSVATVTAIHATLASRSQRPRSVGAGLERWVLIPPTLLAPVLLPLPQHHFTVLPPPRRYGDRYEAPVYRSSAVLALLLLARSIQLRQRRDREAALARQHFS